MPIHIHTLPDNLSRQNMVCFTKIKETGLKPLLNPNTVWEQLKDMFGVCQSVLHCSLQYWFRSIVSI